MRGSGRAVRAAGPLGKHKGRGVVPRRRRGPRPGCGRGTMPGVRGTQRGRVGAGVARGRRAAAGVTQGFSGRRGLVGEGAGRLPFVPAVGGWPGACGLPRAGGAPGEQAALVPSESGLEMLPRGSGLPVALLGTGPRSGLRMHQSEASCSVWSTSSPNSNSLQLSPTRPVPSRRSCMGQWML